MPSTENLYSHSHPGVAPRTGSLTNLARLPVKAKEKLAHLQFVRFIEDNDGQDKDENDIYRQNVRPPVDACLFGLMYLPKEGDGSVPPQQLMRCVE